MIQAIDNIKITIPAVVIAGKTITPAWTSPSFGIPTIPMLAEGGIVTGPTMAIIGEDGPEAIIPLNGSNVGGVGSTIINITVSGFFSDSNSVRMLGNQLATLIKQNNKVRSTP